MQHFILYKTTNLINNKTYIGIHQTSNLDDGYLGSGVAFKRAIRKYGKDNFKREILEICNSFEELIEKERIYVDSNWILRNDNYNLKTGGQSIGILSDESKEKISETLRKGYASGRIKVVRRLGIIPWNKEKTLDVVFDENKVIEIKTKLSNSHKGEIPWNKGKVGLQIAWNKGIKSGPMSNEQKETISKTLKKRYEDTPHPRKGKASWNKGLKLSPSPFKGIERVKNKCPHCEKMVDVANGKRWHFENCRLK